MRRASRSPQCPSPSWSISTRLRSPLNDGVTGYVAGRVLALGVLLFGLLVITFVISHVIPGDRARLAAGPDASEAMVLTLRAQYGLDRSLGTQFVVYTRGLLRGDFGLSLRSRNTVADDLARFFPNSFELVTLSLLLAVAVGVPLGMLSAVYRDTWIDHGSRVMSGSGVAVPAFWLRLMLQLGIAPHPGRLPPGGRRHLTPQLPPPLPHPLPV